MSPQRPFVLSADWLKVSLPGSQEPSLLSLTFWTWCLTVVAVIAIASRSIYPILRSQFKFIWHCFLRPLGGVKDQQSRLNQFYEGQADVYDATRNGLLRGRDTMLSLLASHLKAIRERDSSQPLVWVDLGGGTGQNIEMMNEHIPIAQFQTIYLIDLCEPLLQVARKRFEKRGWGNIVILCQDASQFSLPMWSATCDPRGSVSLITLSYSLSMIPSFYALLDRVDYVLSPNDGILGVVDFYTAGKDLSLHDKAIGGASKECGWLSRWFWQVWFDFDHVSLSPQRRAYLEYKFGTIKSFNERNRFILPFIVRIPYYIWIGRSRSCDVSKFCHAFEVEGGNTIGNCSPTPSTPTTPVKETEMLSAIPHLEIGEPMLTAPKPSSENMIASATEMPNPTIPLSPFHYQISKPWRLPYYEQTVHDEFRTFIYSFTWEDPREDMKYLELNSDDSMLVITSAGDNALHYAAAARPKRIHCVDMNPCQGHLLELKLAAIHSLSHEDFFKMFGDGKHSEFKHLLDTQISPYLSSSAYQFWGANTSSFASTKPSSSFYLSGYSGLALRLARLVFSIAGVTYDVQAMCSAQTIAEQERIWQKKLRPVLLNPVVVALLKNPVFCWNALGVPQNQRRMCMDEGGMYEYIRGTLDPLASYELFGKGAYHYLLTLLGHYTKESCPVYLTQDGFEMLKANDSAALDAFRLHTDSIINVLKGLKKWSLTKAVIMDHLDWFAPGAQEVDEEVEEFNRVVAPGGHIFWRSASRKPWYNAVFEKHGFSLTALGVRPPDGNTAIDGVNMYASFWRAIRNP